MCLFCLYVCLCDWMLLCCLVDFGFILGFGFMVNDCLLLCLLIVLYDCCYVGDLCCLYC